MVLTKDFCIPNNNYHLLSTVLAISSIYGERERVKFDSHKIIPKVRMLNSHFRYRDCPERLGNFRRLTQIVGDWNSIDVSLVPYNSKSKFTSMSLIV